MMTSTSGFAGKDLVRPLLLLLLEGFGRSVVHKQHRN